MYKISNKPTVLSKRRTTNQTDLSSLADRHKANPFQTTDQIINKKSKRTERSGLSITKFIKFSIFLKLKFKII
jgi:hypothetical protein